MKPAGYIIYSGPSLLDGSPIVAIVTGLSRGSKNSKTGAMVQTYIIRSDVKPTDAAKDGRDVAICGDCKHRPVNGGTCYVNLAQGPTAVWKGYSNGSYMPADASIVADMCSGRMVRLGTYGDPAAVPAHIWESLVVSAAGHTGYTHQWRNHSDLMGLVMASADSELEAHSARAAGWRTFRVRTADEPMLNRESVCPASEEAGRKLTCIECGMCNGTSTGRKGSIAIVVHGVQFKRDRFARNSQQRI